MTLSRRRESAYDYPTLLAATAELHGTACWVRGLLERRELVPAGLLRCDGQLDAMHFLAKSTLRREGRAGADMDPRNCRIGCRRHHSLMDGRLIAVFRDELPASVVEFAAEHGLDWLLDRTWHERRRAA